MNIKNLLEELSIEDIGDEYKITRNDISKFTPKEVLFRIKKKGRRRIPKQTQTMCAQCGKSFGQDKLGRKRKFCTLACKSKYYRIKYQKKRQKEKEEYLHE